MDPITRASKAFLTEMEAFWRANDRRVLPMIAGASERSDLAKTLKLHELDPKNRRPLFLYEAPFVGTNAYFHGLADMIEEGVNLIIQGAAEEGVTLGPFLAPVTSKDKALERAVLCMDRAASVLGAKLDGITVALVPAQIEDAKGLRESVAALRQTRLPAGVRLAVWSPPKGPLEEVLGAEGARFTVDQDALVDYLKQLGASGSEGPKGSPPPELTPEAQRDFEAKTGRKLPSPDAALALRALLLDAAQLSARGKHADAAVSYRKARQLCQTKGLVLEEAMILIAIGGACLALGVADLALESYHRAADLARSKEAFQVVCQACLGIGAIHLRRGHHEPAALAYRTAAAAAKQAEASVLVIEALRMEGTCLVLLGSKHHAAKVFQEAVDEGGGLSPAERKATSFPYACKALIDLLRSLGLREQADHVEKLANSPDAPVRVVVSNPSPRKEEGSATASPDHRREESPSVASPDRRDEMPSDAPVSESEPREEEIETTKLPQWGDAPLGEPGPRAGETMELPIVDISETTLDQPFLRARPVLPFRPSFEEPEVVTADLAMNAAPIGLTLEQYASLSAELATFPEATAQILARYGIHSVRERTLWEQPWIQKIRDNAEERRAWEMFYERYRAYWAHLAARGGG